MTYLSASIRNFGDHGAKLTYSAATASTSPSKYDSDHSESSARIGSPRPWSRAANPPGKRTASRIRESSAPTRSTRLSTPVATPSRRSVSTPRSRHSWYMPRTLSATAFSIRLATAWSLSLARPPTRANNPNPSCASPTRPAAVSRPDARRSNFTTDAPRPATDTSTESIPASYKCPTTHGRERNRNLASAKTASTAEWSRPWCFASSATARTRDLSTPPGLRLVNDLGDSRRAGTDPGRQAIRGSATPSADPPRPSADQERPLRPSYPFARYWATWKAISRDCWWLRRGSTRVS